MSCIELVIQDHMILRRGLDILDGMVKDLETGKRIEIADVTSVLKFLQTFGCDYHQVAEEGIVLTPLLRDASREGLLRHMLSEHTEITALTTAAGEALRLRKAGDFIRSSRHLSHFARSHMDQQDTILREIAGQSLSREADGAIAEEYEKHRRDPESLAVDLVRLERKYTRKPVVDTWAAERPAARAQASGSYK